MSKWANIRVTRDMFRQLKAERARTGVPISTIVTRAITDYLAKPGDSEILNDIIIRLERIEAKMRDYEP